ncbi:MAG: hypothetical protein ACE141_09155 [Bryobacteraceae bacterium]
MWYDAAHAGADASNIQASRTLRLDMVCSRSVPAKLNWRPGVPAVGVQGITATEEFDPALFKQLAEGK